MTGKRSYLNEAVKALAHPIRSEIVKQLKKSLSMTPADLVTELEGEDRYNIIHHLKVLKKAGVVGSEEKNGRSISYKLLEVKDPLIARQAVVIFDERDIKVKTNKFTELIEAISAMEGEKIPKKHKINRVEIVIHYA